MTKNGENPSDFEGANKEVNSDTGSAESQNVENDKTTIRHNDETATLPYFEKLPPFLQELCEPFKHKDRELMLMGALTVISSVLPNVYGVYDQRTVYPNLYTYVIGKAGSGKGNLVWLKQLVAGIEQGTGSADTDDLLQKLMDQHPESTPTSKRSITIPANSSVAGFTKILDERGGKGLIFETEGDTLANILKADYGDYSDILRKGFHHEPVSQYRKTDNKYINIKEPKISTLISSTPNQLTRIISSSENGLFSRFCFLFTEPEERFYNVFATKGSSRDKTFAKASQQMVVLYDKLIECDGVEVLFSDEQVMLFVDYLNKSKSQLMNMFHGDLDATVNRMGLIMFRIAIILTVLRNMDTELSGQFVCNDDDFDVVMNLSETLLLNANKAMELLPKQEKDQMSDTKRTFFLMLPNEFSTSEAKQLGGNYALSDRTVDRFLKSACFEKVGHGRYRKAS
ncbi:MAG: YfjI family protein [bacterium]|nr:YfjI family protein [bacterium]